MTPVQEDTLDALTNRKAAPVEDLAELVGRLNSELGDLLDPRDDFYLDSFRLSKALGCQGKPEEAFEWDAAKAVKSVVVEGIRLHVAAGRQLAPSALVGWAIDSLSRQTKGVGEWLAKAELIDRADVTTAAVVQLGQWFEMWPPMDHGWWPAAQVQSFAEFPGLKVKSKVDLAIGKTCNRVLVNVVRGTGRSYDFEPLTHAALVETIRTSVAPRAIVVARPELGRPELHPVDFRVLDGAARRLVGAVGELVRLEKGGQPKLMASHACRYCPALETCSTGQAWLKEQDEEGAF